MMGKASNLSHFLTGKVVLALFVVTAATGGFLLGYFVGKSVSSPSIPPAARQPLSEGESAPPAPVPGPNPMGEGSSAAVPVVQSPSAENKQAEIAPSVPEKTPLKGEARDEGKGAKDVSGSAGSSSGKVVYTVQAGAFRNQKDAEALKRKLEAKKYKTSIKKEADAKGVVFFKVRTGEFENKKEASLFALKLKTDGLNAFATAKK
ncbi:MAG: SPOR domain-containing protein [Nitrospirae bacterium]|nr:SPOR domain-containing protein [Nitrospirota bacterium]